jgi:hypothetical protein
MRIVSRGILATLAGAGLIVITLAGCATSASPMPTPSAVHSPLFASDEEALKAATDAYAAYLAMSDTIAQEGGVNPERIKDYVTGDALDVELTSMKSLADGGLRGVGALAFDSARLQQADLNTGEVSVYLCLDVSSTSVVDASGADHTPTSRPLRLPLNINFIRKHGTQSLIINRSDSWSGQNFC